MHHPLIFPEPFLVQRLLIIQTFPYDCLCIETTGKLHLTSKDKIVNNIDNYWFPTVAFVPTSVE